MTHCLRRVFGSLLTFIILSSAATNNANAQLVAPGLKESIDNLTSEIRDSNRFLNDTANSGNELSNSINNLYELADKNVPSATQSLHDIAESLDTLADFSTSVQENTGKIVAASVGSLAFAIILGRILSKHIFVFDKDKNAIFKAITAGRAWYNSMINPIRREELGIP